MKALLADFLEEEGRPCTPDASHGPSKEGIPLASGRAAMRSGREMSCPGTSPGVARPAETEEEGLLITPRLGLGLGLRLEPLQRMSNAPSGDARRMGSGGVLMGAECVPCLPEKGPFFGCGERGSDARGHMDATSEMAKGMGGSVHAQKACASAELDCSPTLGVTSPAHISFSVPLGDLLLRGPCKPSKGEPSPTLGDSQETAEVGCGAP